MRTEILLAVLLAFVVGGCTRAPEPTCDLDSDLRGTLVWSRESDGLQGLEFPSMTATLLRHPEYFNYGLCLSPGPPGTLIASSNTTISEIDLTTGEMRILRDGGQAVWEPVTDSLVFWHGSSPKDVDQRLQIAARSSSGPSFDLGGAPAPLHYRQVPDFYLVSPPVLLGNGLLAVLNERRQVCLLDARTRSLTATAFEDCWPKAGRGDGRTLFCNDIHSWKVFEVDLLAGTRTELRGMPGTEYVFVPGSNSLLYSTQEGEWFPIPHEVTVTKVYHIADATTCRLDVTLSFLLFGPGSALWIPLPADEGRSASATAPAAR